MSCIFTSLKWDKLNVQSFDVLENIAKIVVLGLNSMPVAT